jgi:hypothetical protein
MLPNSEPSPRSAVQHGLRLSHRLSDRVKFRDRDWLTDGLSNRFGDSFKLCDRLRLADGLCHRLEHRFRDC